MCYYVQVIRDTKIITDRVGRIKLLDAVLVYFVTKLGTRGKKLNFNERIILAKGGVTFKIRENNSWRNWSESKKSKRYVVARFIMYIRKANKSSGTGKRI